MNIFFLDSDLQKCAQSHVDKHVVKMRVELAQLASTAHWQSGGSAPYKQTHINHPSSKWCRESLSNYNYVVDLGLALCNELEFRYGTKEQKCRETLNWLKSNQPNISDLGITTPLLAMDDSFRLNFTPADFTDKIEYAVANYRNYYSSGKQHLYSWTNRQKPQWL